jgi:WD40 repeat protein
MSAAWKTVRVFISSTFRDMHAERDHLVRTVFPELRERCAKRHLHLVDVDLRWGVTEEDAQRGKALEICLHEIEDCRPFFIGLLGERYGWIPPRYDIPDQEQFDALRSIEPGHSITAMEIYHGVLNNPQMRTHAFFFFRDQAFIDALPPEKQLDFRAEDNEHAAKLRQLKDRIRASGLPLRENYRYDDLDDFGRQVLENLWSAIEAEYPEEALEPDPLDSERAYHDFFIETRAELFIGQRHLLARLHEYAGICHGGVASEGVGATPDEQLAERLPQGQEDEFRLTPPRDAVDEEASDLDSTDYFELDDAGGLRRAPDQRSPEATPSLVTGQGQPLLVTGTPGCGKSALLARFVSQFRRLQLNTFILYHFVGASPSSTDPRQMLLRLCRELARRFAFEDEIPQDYSELRVRFWRFCQRAAERQPWVLVLDSLNQLDETHRADELDWLPPRLPPGLRLILSTLEGHTLEAARRKYAHRQNLIVTSLRLVDQGFILARQLKGARKSLTSARKYRLWRKQQMAQGQPMPPDEDRSQLRYILTGVYGRRHEPTHQQSIQRETANPLYLYIVAEELRLFGSFDRLADFIAGLPTDVPGMFQTVLERLEQDHGRELVERSLSLVATGRHGLLENELLELLSRPGEQHLPMALWSRLYRSLAFYLKPRASVGGGEEGLIDFFHRQLAKVVRERYLATAPAQKARHIELADYFRRKGDPAGDRSWKGTHQHALLELPFHEVRSGRRSDSEYVLTDFRFMQKKCAFGQDGVYRLLGDFALATDEALHDRDSPPRIDHEVLLALRQVITEHHGEWEADSSRIMQQVYPWLRWWGSSGPAGPGPSSRVSALVQHEAARWSGNTVWLRQVSCTSAQLAGASLTHEGLTRAFYCDGGSKILTVGNGVKLWDATTFEPLSCTEETLGTKVWSVRSFIGAAGQVDSPAAVSSNGVLAIVTGITSRWVGKGNGTELSFVSILSGTQRQCWHMRSEPIRAIGWSPDGSTIAVCRFDGSAELWSYPERELVATLLTQHRGGGLWRDPEYPAPGDDWPTYPAFTSDGEKVAIGREHCCYVWDRASGRLLASLREDMEEHEPALLRNRRLLPNRTRGLGTTDISCVAFSTDGRYLAIGMWDGTIRIRDVKTWQSLALLENPAPMVTDLSWLSSRPDLVASYAFCDARHWQIEPHVKSRRIASCGSTAISVAVHPDERSTLFTERAGVCHVAQLEVSPRTYWHSEALPWELERMGPYPVDWMPRGDLVTAGPLGEIALIDGRLGTILARAAISDKKITAVACARDTEYICAGNEMGEVMLLDGQLRLVRQRKLMESNSVYNLEFACDGECVVATAHPTKGSLCVWNLEKDDLWSPFGGKPTSGCGNVFNKFGRLVFVTNRNPARMFIWDIRSPGCPLLLNIEMPELDKYFIMAMVVDGAGGRCWIGGGKPDPEESFPEGWTPFLGAVDLACGTYRKVFESPTGRVVSCLDISADDRLLAIRTCDDGVRIWSVEQGCFIAEQTHKRIPMLEFSFGSIKWSPTGRLVAVGGQDGIIVCDTSGRKIAGMVGKGCRGPINWSCDGEAIGFVDGAGEPCVVRVEGMSTRGMSWK